jgi:signal peptidase II
VFHLCQSVATQLAQKPGPRLPPYRGDAMIAGTLVSNGNTGGATSQESLVEVAETPPDGRPWPRLRNDLLFFALAGLVVVLDQVTKYLVRAHLSLGESFPDEGPVRITYVTNTGAAFGILQGQTLFLMVTTFFGLAAILLYYLYPPMEHGILRLALGLQLGGAVGNLTDRVRLDGKVTDFIDIGPWPNFNLADSSIVVGVTIIIVFFLLAEGRQRRTMGP